MIFRFVIEEHFREYPESREIQIKESLEPWVINDDQVQEHHVPPFEVTLIPERIAYREFFGLRISLSTIIFHQSLAFNWDYEFPSFSSQWEERYESLDICQNCSCFGSDGSSPAEAFWRDHAHCLMPLRQGLPDLDGWGFEYPGLRSMSQLMRNSIAAARCHPSPFAQLGKLVPMGMVMQVLFWYEQLRSDQKAGV